MKWLRSSLFKDNKDKFIFEEKLNISLSDFDTSLKGVEDVVVSGTFTRNGQDKILVDLKINGIYKIISSRSLKELSVPFSIEEREEFFDKNTYYNDTEVLENNVMDIFIDLNYLVNELIILNVPTSHHLEEEQFECSSGKDWSLVFDEDLVKKSKENNPFSTLSDMFKEK